MRRGLPLSESPGAAYGWRARLGYLPPSSVVENNAYEFYLMAPPGTTIALAPMSINTFGADAAEALLARLPWAVGQLLDRKVDVLVQAGVPQIVVAGWGFEDRVRAEVARLTDLPFVTDIAASIEAMRGLHMKQVAMVSPFDDAIHDRLARYVKNAGIDIVAAQSIRGPGVEQIDSVPLAVPYRAARQAYRSAGDPDGVWITGAGMPSVAIIDPLERDLGVPVVTAMQAMFWAGMRLAGADYRVEGFGRLLTTA